MATRNAAATVGAYDAKTHFSELLVRVANGEEITIVRHGMPVARLVPITSTASPAKRRTAIARMRNLATGTRLRGLSVRRLMSEGRR